jgi:hypothetical protein
MKAITIAIYFEDGAAPGGVTIGSEINGGKVTAMAVYDLFEASEIAEAALEECNAEVCIEAREKINSVIANR